MIRHPGIRFVTMNEMADDFATTAAIATAGCGRRRLPS
jgi:hypothetical protein